MNFESLIDGAEFLSRSGGAPDISGVDYDSRRIGKGFVFIAMKGESTDGNRYIDYHAAFAPHFLGHNDPCVTAAW